MYVLRRLRYVTPKTHFSPNTPHQFKTNTPSLKTAAHRMDVSTATAVQESTSHHHDTHALPPAFIQKEHWRYNVMKKADLDIDPNVFNLRKYDQFTEDQAKKWSEVGTIPAEQIETACEAYSNGRPLSSPPKEAIIYEHTDFPGLQVIPKLLPPETQILFASCLMHRDLSDPTHKINLQTDYNIPYPPPSETPSDEHRFDRSFFTRDRAAPEENLVPKAPEKQKPLNHEQFLYSKLRWLTLGEQYDWPTRCYAKHATPFPADLSKLVTGFFPHIRPESGVVLLYSGKDFMPVHRDVSEQCQRALASFSIGCDGIFILAKGEDDGVGPEAPRTVAIRVRSGDCVHLDGEARWAWHAMARTIPGTCPSYLASWPVGTPDATAEEEKAYKKWKGYMGSKRINVSCRQHKLLSPVLAPRGSSSEKRGMSANTFTHRRLFFFSSFSPLSPRSFIYCNTHLLLNLSLSRVRSPPRSCITVFIASCAAMAASARFRLAEQVYQHVVLPRVVPGRADENLANIDANILQRLIVATKAIAPFLPDSDRPLVDQVRLALSTAKVVNVEGNVDKHMLIQELRNLEGNNVLIVYVKEQYSALLIYREVSSSGGINDEIIFEAFETSAKCEKVLASENALLWDFPGQAAAVPTKVFMDDSFQECLAAFLEQASMESINQFAAITLKAAKPLPEVRDTPNPTLISEVLMSILKALGRLHASTLLWKRVRDTVSFDKAEQPWRRSPFYLVLRVSMQRQLYKDLGPEVGRLHFKTIMSLFVLQFLDDSHRVLTHEISHYLRTKLGLRLAKLEVDHDRIHGAKRQHDHIFRSLRPIFNTSLSTVDRYLKDQWQQQKKQLRRPIFLLPENAQPADLELTLPLSGQYLEKILRHKLIHKPAHQQSADELLGSWEATNPTSRPISGVLSRHIELAKFEQTKVLRAKDHSNHSSTQQACTEISHTLTTYINNVGEAYNDYPLLKSQMLLHVMELWMSLDRLAISEYELLEHFHPHFQPHMLDDLQLLGYEDMARLRRVQSYIEGRCQQAGAESLTIFASPSKDCFAARYVDESPHHISLRKRIEVDAERARAQKEEEWKITSKRHEELSKQIAELRCVGYVIPVDAFGRTVQEHKGCQKHRLAWDAKQTKIGAHEHPLPRSDPGAKVVVFELDCPETFRIYRDATWLILKRFAHAAQKPLTTISTLSEYSSLMKYSKRLAGTRISLGSSTKSHLKTHYSVCRFPVALKDVSTLCGLKWDYFDSTAAAWASHTDIPLFARHFPLGLPSDSAYGSLIMPSHGWRTSNEILASQTKCPPELNVHEFMAWQGIMVGTHCRWLSLLRELGATNLNFSTYATWAIVCRLVYQAGPGSTDCVPGEVHGVLSDKHFCIKMLEQIRQRVESIRRNWREFTQMDIMLSILEKIASFSSNPEVRRTTLNLFETARQVTWEWQKTLKSSHATDSSGTSLFLIWAALLCKRTFYQLQGKQQHGGHQRIRSYLGSSITQNNLIGSFSALSLSLRHALHQDIAHAYTVRSHIRVAINMDCPGTLLHALDDIWAVPRAPQVELTSYDDRTFWLAVLLVSDNYTTSYIHFNVLGGMLLINGQPLGALPPEYRRPVIKRLFGNMPLHVFPSTRPGMSLVVSGKMPFGHRIHLGFSDGEMVVRAEQGLKVLEYVPAELFSRGMVYDFPNALIEDCYHWMDLTCDVMEIRQGHCWKSKTSNWYLDMNTRRATRRKSTLVDPHSQLYKLATMNVLYFEEPRHITLYQPLEYSLSVELKRLELSFSVSPNGLLRSKQLGAVIERDQDGGTWYGLCNSILIRSTANPAQRSILVPLGKFFYQRYAQHVRVQIQNSGNYLRFSINDTLGRIECPAEPRLLYTKALCHAYTSHFLPDPLTRRPGLDEALYNLGTALYQPWTTINPHVADMLTEISRLTPSREYYPSGLRYMKSVRWSPLLTSHIQDDRYRGVIDAMSRQLADLAVFGSEPPVENPLNCPNGDLHLEKRAQSRIYVGVTGKDHIYNFRDADMDSEGHLHVASISQAPATWSPIKILSTPSLLRLFQQYHICSRGVEPDLVRLLVNYSICPTLKELKPPDSASFVRFIADELPNVERLAALMQDSKMKYVAQDSPDISHRSQLILARLAHEKEGQQACMKFAESVLAQWPSLELDSGRLAEVDAALFDAESARESVQPEWTRLAENFRLSQYLSKDLLARDLVFPGTNLVEKPDGGLEAPTQREGALTNPAHVDQETRKTQHENPGKPRNDLGNTPLHIAQLKTLVVQMRDSPSAVQHRYGNELEESIDALLHHRSKPGRISAPFNPTALFDMLANRRADLDRQLHCFQAALRSGVPHAQWLQHVGLWPHASLVPLLSQLRSTSGTQFGHDVQQRLINLGLAVTEYQRLRRIIDATQRGRHQQLEDESSNPGHENWDVQQRPDWFWLLLEIEGDILLRPEQVEVALATISPTSKENSVLQLLMGKGKTSCILPMVALELSDKNRLVRIVVPRALLLQPAQFIQTKVGALWNRQIFHLPFSRKTRTDMPDTIRTFCRLHQMIRASSGIILALPEHILSFKLSGLQRLWDGKLKEASSMLKAQAWLDSLSFRNCNTSSHRASKLLKGLSEPTLSCHMPRADIHSLVSTLKKRWNVQFGLHPDRHPIAVPFLVKGVPSPTSEWGHPDVAIILTCVSFYYEGLSVVQFKQALDHLMKSDEPSIEYEKWATKTLPEALRDFHAINVEDTTQLSELHKHIRFNVFLDFYLNNFVFPKHAKQFKSKLQASGLDLVLYNPRRKGCQTTGFSGTNDTRHQRPMTIKQNDLPSCHHTNAEVLSYLLEPRNQKYVRMVDRRQRRLTEEGILRKLLNPHDKPQDQDGHPPRWERIRVLIDAGAQILEHGNKSLAQLWLKIDHEAVAAVYFDSEHRARVVWGKGKDTPLSASPYAGSLEECLVYLDESHCRGTDLPLPPNARAALTLGPHLTKDALAQAAMRLRLLGKRQSVTFFSPPEVHQSILDLRGDGDSSYHPTSADVIRWLLEQTCNSIEQMEPLYYTQGINYFKRLQAGLDNDKFLDDEVQRRRYLRVVRTDEMQTLRQLYEPKHVQRSHARTSSRTEASLSIHLPWKKWNKSGRLGTRVEDVREVQKPVHYEPLKTRGLHRDIEEFALKGRLPAGSDAYQPMPTVLQQTAVGRKHGTLTAATMASSLYLSKQFSRVVKLTEPNDNFIRPCQWILWSPNREIALLVSPEEANRLLALLQRHAAPACHLIVYAAPVTRKMLHFNSLDYYSVPTLPPIFEAPTWLKIQLGIFSGRLYFGWDEYEAMLAYLGVGNSKDDQTEGWGAFATQPLTFLHDWLAVRRKGQDFEHTPMGAVTTGKPLSSHHPFILSVVADQDHRPQAEQSAPARVEVDRDSDSDDEEYHDAFDGDEDGPLHEATDYDDETFANVEENHPFFTAGEHEEAEVDGQEK
ncbi:hypothetical protein M011DRAFT_527167 [Sporormia fimetaria CBS 119925]|uniref:Uncharacterized protein n=1 Tax=Sporormia fimetaria CBS 119925 TaxID=1340428 RepID=A0A6A6V662_9PLEO|nr:hypothetical protein M011DRAFT_527167 [Sporormia fimetaria CBS 119925]